MEYEFKLLDSFENYTNDMKNMTLNLITKAISEASQNKNNNLDNLRLICPNCDALLPTFAGRNRGNGRVYRRLRYAEGKSS